MKSKNDKTTTIYCPECKTLTVCEDQRLAELYCYQCGLVIKMEYIEDG